jgi:hypothetical protein
MLMPVFFRETVPDASKNIAYMMIYSINKAEKNIRVTVPCWYGGVHHILKHWCRNSFRAGRECRLWQANAGSSYGKYRLDAYSI